MTPTPHLLKPAGIGTALPGTSDAAVSMALIALAPIVLIGVATGIVSIILGVNESEPTVEFV